MPNNNGPKYFKYIIAVVLVIVGIILVASSLRNDKVELLPVARDVINQTTRVVNATNFEYIIPENWEFYDNAMEDIQALQEDQTITFGIVRDPLEDNYVYFATHSVFKEAGETLISLYKYNEDDYSFERLWRKTFTIDDEDKILDVSPYWPTMHVLGYENNNLIVLFQQIDDSPGPCSSPWLMGWGDRSTRNMMTLDLTDPYGGFDEYTPSDKVIDMAEDAVDECEDLM